LREVQMVSDCPGPFAVVHRESEPEFLGDSFLLFVHVESSGCR
jgi:hypothetical protein